MYLKIHDIKLEMETISPLDPRGKMHREKEFGWNSTVRLVVDSLVSRGNWSELFNGSPTEIFTSPIINECYTCSSCSCYLFKVNTPRRK